jgi:hypothetical protein
MEMKIGGLSGSAAQHARHALRLAWWQVAWLLPLLAHAAQTFPVAWYGGVFVLDPVDSQQALRAQLSQPLAQVFALEAPDGEAVRIRTCQDLFAADARGLDRTGSDHVAYRYQALSCYAARAIAGARASTRSSLRDFALDRASVQQLPAGLWLALSAADRAKAAVAGARFGDLVGEATYQTTATAASRQVMVDAADGRTQAIAWVARGDFDGDGGEDLLLATHDTDERSGHEGFRLVVVSRPAANAAFRIVKTFPVNGPAP